MAMRSARYVIDCRFGMTSERTADTSDVVIGLAGQETGFAVPVLPQSGEGERQERQRAPLALDLGQHLLDQIVVLEAIAALRGRLDHRRFGARLRSAAERP